MGFELLKPKRTSQKKSIWRKVFVAQHDLLMLSTGNIFVVHCQPSHIKATFHGLHGLPSGALALLQAPPLDHQRTSIQLFR